MLPDVCTTGAWRYQLTNEGDPVYLSLDQVSAIMERFYTYKATLPPEKAKELKEPEFYPARDMDPCPRITSKAITVAKEVLQVLTTSHIEVLPGYHAGVDIGLGPDHLIQINSKGRVEYYDLTEPISGNLSELPPTIVRPPYTQLSIVS